MHEHRLLVLGVLLGLGAGCTGGISTPAGGGGSGAGPGGNDIKPGTAEPGRVTLRRLNQTEYDNTVRDLLGSDSRPARTFLSDSQANGFDNNGDFLSLSPTRLEQYQAAAVTLATEALSPPLRARNLTCDPAAGDSCVRTFLGTLGERAYRRPLSDSELTGYLQLAAKVRAVGGSPDEVMGAVLQALLISPNFLFRPEYDPEPTSTRPHPLAPDELASRLSYLVYASMPDEALFAAARGGQLKTAKDAQAQLQRMLSDPRSRFAESYAEQWLGVRSVETAEPDAKLYPGFSPALGIAMKREVDLFFDEFLRQNLPPEQLLTANFTYVDTSLARHYGLPPVATATGPTRVTLATPQRGGLLGMGALLVATSRGNRTSPVARGRWVLDALMCAPPPPPPDTVMLPSEETITATSAHEFLAKHRENPTCAACHNTMDPIGLALENYDAVGAWRETDHGKPIDTSGVLPDGTRITGRADLEVALAKDPRLRDCLTRSLLTYGVGRALRDQDSAYVDAVVKGTGTAGASRGMRDLLMGVVASDAFRMRRGEP